MKKIIIVLLALFLALPAISYAGSVTSRWDMTIGGYVAVNMGYSDQAQGAEAIFANRSGMQGSQSLNNEYGNFFSAVGETRLNFLIKGPDGGGAKTSAFIEGDFRGATATGEGNFALRHAFLKLDWPNATLTAGQTWQRWGFIPSYAVVGSLYGFNDLGPFQKGQRQPRLDYEQRFGKNWSAALALVSPNNIFGTVGDTTVNNYSLSRYPFLEGEFKFTTDKCGKVGPYGMMMALGGFYGQEKYVNQYSANPNLYTDRNINAWAISLKGFIPIIPEKNKNKAGALAIGGNLFYGQNYSWFAGPVASQNSYQRANTAGAFNAVYVAPVSFGGFGQITYFFTDKFFVDGYYGYLGVQTSAARTVLAPNAVSSQTQAIININYDLNQAVRFGAQYAYVKTAYNNFGGAAPNGLTDRAGSSNTFRIGAFYFF